MSVRNRFWASALTVAVGVMGLPLLAAPAQAALVGPSVLAAQALPGHTGLVPAVPRKDTPRISNGEIWDMEVVGNRVFIAGSFTSLANTIAPTTTVNQAGLASYNINTGLIDTNFRPTFNGAVNAVEASPDGTKLYVAGSFSTVSGVARQKVASLNLTTGVPVASFAVTQSTNNYATALAATNSTVYVGGRFSRINGQLRTGLAALNGTTGAVDLGFDNSISGGIGVDGALTVQQLKLTHDDSKLLVVHTGRKIAGQDRLGIGLINTQTKQLLPWRTRLWDDNLAIVGGIQRIYAGDIAPNDQYFVVGSGSGGDRPPISDTAIAYPIAGGDNVQPLWIARCFDSIYSIAISESAVYIGGHFSWNESPTANQPWPGLDNVGYGTGQGLSGYGLGDQVVRRDHIGALDPATGTALEWNPGSNSFEGNKAMEATSRGLFVGGDGMFQGGVRTGRVAFYDFNSVPAASTTDTTITSPIEGRVVTSGVPFTIQGTAKNPQGIRRVQVEIQDRNSKQFLQDDGVTWGRSNNIYATLGAGTTNRDWSLPVTVTGNHELQIMAKTFGTNGTNDATKAVKKIESFSFDDQTPTTNITGPSGIQTSTTFTMTGTANDDHGVNSLTYWFRDENQNYLQNDGTVGPIFNTFRGTPDVVGATSATWSYEVTLPHEGVWRGSATAVDTAGQADLRSGVRDFTVNSNAVAPTVGINQPVSMTPPFAVPTVVVNPGSPMTFSGTASDDDRLKNVEITLRNTTTRENLGADGTWGVGISAGNYRISPVNINAASYNWSYTTPFNLSPGTYSFTVRATDNDDLITSSANQGRLTVSAQVPGDLPPDGLVNPTGTFTVTAPEVPLAGTATDDKGVQSVELTVFDNDTGRYMQNNGQMLSGYNRINATLSSPGATSTAWTLPIVLPTGGDYSITVYAFDTVGQQDPSTTGATARYRYYPGDLPPAFEAALGQPVDGSTFTEGKIVVSGRAVDDISIARVEVGVVNSLGQYMSSTGTFTSTTPSWRQAFLNSPGSPGSNFSYTTPVIPDGTYSVLVRPTDHHDQIGETRTSVGIVVTHPVNNAPVASATVSCTQNVCSFDGRGSTDENPTSLVYSWNFGTNQGTGSGPIPVKTYTAPGTYSVVLTVRDEWNVTSTATLSVTITEPAGNVAPVPTFLTSCLALACSTSSTGTVDPNLGDTIAYVWNWGDGTPTSTGTAPAHTYAVPGTYTITLTTTDGWGKAASTTRQVALIEPATNQPPTVTFTTSCTLRVCQMNSFGTSDPNGDVIRYSWNWGDGTAVSTAASPSHTYTAPGTFTITLTVTDGWNKVSSTTRTVTVT
jgi:large repetitive protein